LMGSTAARLQLPLPFGSVEPLILQIKCKILMKGWGMQ
jgi:hypothetical protein